jgi:hypothetical protein
VVILERNLRSEDRLRADVGECPESREYRTADATKRNSVFMA